MTTRRSKLGEPAKPAATKSRDPLVTATPGAATGQPSVAFCGQPEPAPAGSEPAPHPQESGSPGNAPDQQVLAQRTQRAYARIAEDPAITSDLTDAPARQLLAWAHDEVWRLVAETQTLDEAQAWAVLDPQIATLRRYLRRIARDAARQPDVRAALATSLVPPDYAAS